MGGGLILLKANTNTKSSSIYVILLLLTLLPSINFNLYDAEVFPWALIFSLVFCKGRISIHLLLVLFFLLSNAILNVLITKGSFGAEYIRSLAAYINVLIVFDVLLNLKMDNRKNIKIITVFFIFITLFGLLQNTGLLKSLDPFIKLFIPRGYAYSLEFMGGRGVTLLSSEPARAGLSYIFIFLCIREFSPFEKRKILFLDFMVFLFLLLIIKSAMAILLFMFFFFIQYRRLSLILTTFVFTSLSLYVVNLESTNRTIILAESLYNTGSLSDFFHILMNTGGQRVLSIFTSYYYSLVNPLGGGIGSWEVSSIESLYLLNINPSDYRYFIVHGGGEAVSFRSSGYLSNLALDTGIVGLIVFFVYFTNVITKYFSLSVLFKFPIFWVFLIKVLFVGSVGTPVSWVCFAIYIKAKYEVSINEKKCNSHSII